MAERRDGETRQGVDRLSSLTLAAIIAVLAWLSSISIDRPIDERDLPEGGAASIPIEFSSVPDDMVAYAPETRQVQATVRGIAAAVVGLEAEELQATVDVSPMLRQDQSEARLRVQVRCRRVLSCWRRGIRVVSVTPPEILVRLDSLAEESRQPVIETVDDPLPECLILRRQSEPDSVTLRGAAEMLARVDRVEVTVPGLADRACRDLSAVLDVRALDVAGRPVPGVSIEPSQLDVALRINKQGVPAYVLVRPSGEVAAGHSVIGVQAEPEVVQLSGPPSMVQQVKGDLSVTVDVKDRDADVVSLVQLDLPEGVSAVNAPDGVTVTVRIGPVPGTRSLEVPLTIVGDLADTSVTLSPQQVLVILSGPQPVLDGLDPEMIRAELRVTGLGIGSHQQRPQVIRDETLVAAGVRVIGVTPEEVGLELRRSGGPQGTPRAATPSLAP